MKGAVLTQISAWWFNQLEGVVPHHMISADADTIISRSACPSKTIALRSPDARCCAGAPRCFRSNA